MSEWRLTYREQVDLPIKHLQLISDELEVGALRLLGIRHNGNWQGWREVETGDLVIRYEEEA